LKGNPGRDNSAKLLRTRSIEAPANRQAARITNDGITRFRLVASVGNAADFEVSAAAVELALVNYLSNAIKYRDPAQSPRFVTAGRFDLDNVGTHIGEHTAA